MSSKARRVWCVAYRGDLQMSGYKTARTREVGTRVEAEQMRGVLSRPIGKAEPRQDVRIQTREVTEWADDA